MIYILDAETALWVYPFMELLGISCQIAVFVKRSIILLLFGYLLVCVGALIERDAVLLVGDTLASLGLGVLYYKANTLSEKR